MTKKALQASLALWERRLAVRRKLLVAAREAAHAREPVTAAEAAKVHLREAQVAEAERLITRRTGQIAAKVPLRLRAYRVAVDLIGVMEEGGNNQGPMVSKIIRANGGAGPEPWCGDGMAYCYRLAGSKAVQRLWASVWWLGQLAGLSKIRAPRMGDLVRFKFDHVGMFVRDLGNGQIETVEFNTGPSGAVSDSSTGGDGVYRKHRAKSLVQDYLRVSR